MEQTESKPQFSPEQNQDPVKNQPSEPAPEEAKQVDVVLQEPKPEVTNSQDNDLGSVKKQGIKTLQELKESYARLLDRIPLQLKKNCMEVELEVKNMLYDHLEQMKDNSMRQIKGNEAEKSSQKFLLDIQSHIERWREMDSVTPQDLISLGTFAGKHDNEKQKLEKYLTRFQVMLMFNTDNLKRSLQELVKVKVVDKEKEREEEEKKRIAQKQQEERDRKAAELKQAKKLAEESAQKEENNNKYLIQPIEGSSLVLMTDLTQRKMRWHSYRDAKGNHFNFPKHAACCSYEDSVIICGGKEPKTPDSHGREPNLLSTTILVKYPHYLYFGPQFSEGRFDMGIAVVQHKLIITGGYRVGHLATCERLNLKTMRKDIAEKKPINDEPGSFGGNYERIANLVTHRSGHACTAFQNSCYVLCGYNWSPMNSIEKYWSEKNEWKIVQISNNKEVWEKRTLIAAVQVDQKDMVVYGNNNKQNRTFILGMEEKDSDFHISSIAISRDVPNLQGFKQAVVVNNKGCLHTFDRDYNLWRYQRDWQCIWHYDNKAIPKSNSQPGSKE